MNKKIENLNVKFENLKDRFSKDEIILVFAKIEIEELIVNLESLLDSNLNKTDATQLRALKNQMNEFYELIESLMEERISTNN